MNGNLGVSIHGIYGIYRGTPMTQETTIWPFSGDCLFFWWILERICGFWLLLWESLLEVQNFHVGFMVMVIHLRTGILESWICRFFWSRIDDHSTIYKMQLCPWYIWCFRNGERGLRGWGPKAQAAIAKLGSTESFLETAGFISSCGLKWINNQQRKPGNSTKGPFEDACLVVFYVERFQVMKITRLS